MAFPPSRIAILIGLCFTLALLLAGWWLQPLDERTWHAPLLGIAGCLFTVLLVYKAQADQRHNEQLRRQNEAIRREVLRQTGMLRQVLATIPVRVYWKDRQGRYLGCNPLFAQDAGLESPEQIIGKRDEELVWHKQAALYRADDLQVLETGQAKLAYEEPCSGPDGQELWQETSKIPLTNESGEIIGVLGTYKDITLRKQAERSLRDSEARMAQAQRIADVGHWYWELAPDEVHCSEAARRIFGMESQAGPVKGPTFLTRSHPEDREFLNQAVAQALSGDWRYQIQHRVADSERVVEEIGEVRLDERGKPFAIEGTVQDVTERVKTLEDRELYRLMIEKTADPVFLTDMEECFRMAYVNEAAVRHFGAPKEEILTWHLPDWDPNFSYDQLPALQETVKNQPGLRLETVHKVKSGALVPVEISVNLVRYKGRVCTFGYIKNISERKETERKLREAKEQAETAARMKSAFLANMSHEIRTPMNAVINFNRLVLQTPLDDKQRIYLEKALAAGENLLGLLNDILDFSKVEAGKQEIQQQPFSLHELVDAVSDLTLHWLDGRAVAFSVDLPPSLPPLLLGDALRIRQVLTNLLSNAAKFTEQGSVALRLRCLEQTGQSLRLALEVSDTGIGISPEQQARLFQAFQQADGSITRKYGGTGLGLAISQRLLQLMGSELQLDSSPGAGSRFHFTLQLPIAAAPADQPAAEQDSPKPSAETLEAIRGARVLLVEDNPINLEIAVHILQRAGLEVVAARDGQAALEALAGTGPFDLVLMDLQMPYMDGYEATRQIRRQAQWQRLPIVAITAHALSGDRERCLEAGMNDHLGKPIHIGELHSVLLRWIAPRAGSDSILAALEPAQGEPLPDSLPGIDLVQGLARVSGHRALYLKLLRRFAAGQENTPAALQAAVAAGRSEEARRIAHTLKSVAGNLGATDLAQAAAALESRLAQGNGAAKPDDSLLAAFCAELERIRAGLDALQRPAEPVETAQASQQPDRAAIAPLLREFTDLLEKDLPQAQNRLNRLSPLLAGTALHSQGERLKAALADYDTEEALQIAQAIASALEPDPSTGASSP
jgi:PAS domain S-box-containing protein